jgi:pimeloyl-ACP methyl ester carboxylesterase
VENLRIYGKAPFDVAVVHGGPGAGREMAPMARELSSAWGVLEPLQTATSLEGQVQELKAVLEEHGTLPVTAIGFSWGAWLSYIVAARYPSLIGKLILVGSGPFEEQYVASLHETRLSRLSEGERAELASILEILDDPSAGGRDAAFARFGALFSKTDAYDPIPGESDEPGSIDPRVDIYQGVWEEAAELRRSGTLLELGGRIRCPVVAIHGDYDPHPAAGVQVPLSAILKRVRASARFRFVLLEHCGHKPWIERRARDRFYALLAEELRERVRGAPP